MTARPSAVPPGVRFAAALFDAGNTLLWLDHARIAAILLRAGIPCDATTVRHAEMRARPAFDRMRAAAPKREGAESVRQLSALVLSGLGVAPADPRIDAAAPALRDAWPDLWSDAPADAAPSLARIAAAGIRLGVVSNSDGRVDRRLAAAGLLAPFQVVVDSGTEGIEKPDPRLFLRAAERLGVEPSQCAYLGDLWSLDVLGARSAGMHGVLLDPIGAWDLGSLPDPCVVSSIGAFADLVCRGGGGR